MSKYRIKEPMPQYGANTARIINVPDEVVKQIRADAIDDFANWLVEEFEKKVSDMCFCEYHDAFIDAIEIVKQGGVSDVCDKKK